MIVVHLAIGLVVLSLLFVHGRDQLWLLYLVTFLYGLAGDIFSAARSALLRVMLPEEMLVDANAVLQTSREGLRLVAPLAGAGLYAAFGGGVVAVLDAVTFGLSALSLLALHVDEPRPEPSGRRFRTELAAGMRHIAHTRGLRQIVVGVAVALLVVGFAETLIFTILDRVLHRPPSFFGVLASLQGAGAIVGGLSAPRLLRRLGDTKLVGLGLIGYLGNEGLQEIKYKKLEDSPAITPAKADSGWLGITDKYWAAALIPADGKPFQPRFLKGAAGSASTSGI